MNINFIIIQLIGILAWLFLFTSYYRENTNKILIFQIISAILFGIHYYLLGAHTAIYICIFAIIIDYSYYKTDLDRYIFYISIPIYIIIGMINYKIIIDILPIISSLIDGYTLTKHKKVVIIGAIISYTLWVIYDLNVKSYSGAITDIILAISNLSILLFKYNIFKKDETVHKLNH